MPPTTQKERTEEATNLARETGAFDQDAVKKAGEILERGNGVLRSDDFREEQDFQISEPSPVVSAPGLQGSIDSTLASQQRQREREAEQAGQKEEQSFEDFTKAITERITESEIRDREGGDVDVAQKEVDEFESQLEQEQLALRRQTERVQQEAGLTKGQANARISELERKSLTKQADIAVLLNASRRRFDSAKAILDRKVDIQLERQENLIQARALTYERNKSLFDKSEQRAFEAQQLRLQNQVADKRAELETIRDLTLMVAKNTAPSSVIKAVSSAKSSDEAIIMAGAYLNDPLDRAIKSLSYQKANMEFQDYKTTQEVLKSSEWGNVIQDASNLVGAERGEQTKKAMATAINDGNFGRAFSIVANNVEEALTGENATKFGAARNDYLIMKQLKEAIVDFDKAGGDLGLLTGKAEEISNKLLGVTTSPELTALAVQLERRFQAYRTQMTGAAFSPEESRDYAKVNPRTTASFDLNTAIIDGALADLENTIVSTTESRVNGAENLWNLSTGYTTRDYIENASNAVEQNSGDDLDMFLREVTSEFNLTN